MHHWKLLCKHCTDSSHRNLFSWLLLLDKCYNSHSFWYIELEFWLMS